MLAAEFNRPGLDVVDHRTWVFLGDGCLMEGISHEACSLAGTLKLGKLICLYDDNDISIDGEVERLVYRRYAGTLRGLRLAGDRGRRRPRQCGDRGSHRPGTAETERPTLICCKTVIGFGAPNKQGSAVDARCAARRRRNRGGPRRHSAGTHRRSKSRETLRRPGTRANVVRRTRRPGERFCCLRRRASGAGAEFARRMNGELPATGRVSRTRRSPRSMRPARPWRRARRRLLR